MAQTVIADDILVASEDEYTVGLDAQGRVRISPTDVSQFIRLDQCERYLRLRLHERSTSIRFMHDYGVVPQAIPPLLTQSGVRFEEDVERIVAAGFRSINLALQLQVAEGVDIPGSRPTDNERVVALARDLDQGETLVLFQPRLLVALGSWDVRGDIDILRLARDPSGALQILIADIKSSTAAKVEHRLQVAFYAEMVAALLAGEGIAVDQMSLGVLYRGPTDDTPPATAADRERRELERTRALDLLGVEDGLFELIDAILTGDGPPSPVPATLAVSTSGPA